LVHLGGRVAAGIPPTLRPGLATSLFDFDTPAGSPVTPRPPRPR